MEEAGKFEDREAEKHIAMDEVPIGICRSGFCA